MSKYKPMDPGDYYYDYGRHLQSHPTISQGSWHIHNVTESVSEEGRIQHIQVDAARSAAALVGPEPHTQVPWGTGSYDATDSSDINNDSDSFPPFLLTQRRSPPSSSHFSTFLDKLFPRHWDEYFRRKRRRTTTHKQVLGKLLSFCSNTIPSIRSIPPQKLFISTRKRVRSVFPIFASRRLPFPQTNTSQMFLLISLAVLGGLFHYMWKAEAALNTPWTPDPSSVLFAQRPLPRPIETTFLLEASASSPRPQQQQQHQDESAGDDERDLDDGRGETEEDQNGNGPIGQIVQQGKYKGRTAYYDLPLRTRGRNIVDQNGRRFKLSSVNWYGASDELFIPGGLDVQHRDTIAATIRKLGFNSVRLPYSDEMVMSNPTILPHLVSANPDLIGLRAMDILEKCVEALTDAGIAVIVNNHITTATWCCGADPCDAGWANDHLGPLCRVKQTEDEWIEHWETVMGRFIDNPLVIGADLRNEVRGVWGTMTWDRWATAAERAGNALLKMNPDWLIVVGGTESGNDLTGVGKRPVKLDIDHRVVYSAHVYAWSGWGSSEGRYAKRSYPSFVRAMRTNWAYLVEDNEAPVWIGEFGAPHTPSEGDANYWTNLLRYLKSIDADFGYWAINPRKPKDDEKESYSLVKDDWVTPVLDYRMKDMVELMRIPPSYPAPGTASYRASSGPPTAPNVVEDDQRTLL